MVRLYLFAEGETEQAFADIVLKPHLASFSVYLHPPVLIANARKKGKIYRGGGRRYIPMKNDIIRFLKQEKGRDVYFTTMIDLYAIPTDFPGLNDTDKLRHTPQSRVGALQKSFGADIDDNRFIPFIQLHEYEACLFVEPAALNCFYNNCEKQIARLQAIADSYATPESIDDGQHSAPSKRIIAEFPDYESAKCIVGPQAADLIGLPKIREKCPHFDEWISRLERLAHDIAT